MVLGSPGYNPDVIAVVTSLSPPPPILFPPPVSALTVLTSNEALISYNLLGKLILKVVFILFVFVDELCLCGCA